MSDKVKKILKIVAVVLMGLGITGFLLLGGTEGQVTGITALIIAAISAVGLLIVFIKGLLK